MSSLSAVAALLVALSSAQDPSRDAHAAAPGADTAVVRELRALRESLERFLAANVRAQLLMGRLQLQEARIQTIVRQANDLDAQVAQLSRERDELAQRRSVMERLARESADTDVRQDAGREIAAIGERIKQLDARLAAVGTDLASVQQVLATEQNRWGEFNGRLEALELELHRR